MQFLHSPSPDDPLAVHVVALENGLQVWLSVNKDLPRVFASIVARVGAAEDPPDATGAAHALEHLLANKGTQRLGTLDFDRERPYLDHITQLFDEHASATDDATRAALRTAIDQAEREASVFAVPNELKRVYAAMGGRGFNATTNKERTNFFIDLPANRMAQWAALEGDRFSQPVFRAFQTELETICEEKYRALDNAGKRVSAVMDRMLWGEHPYGNETLGELTHLLRPRVSALRRFFHDWYVPGNMAVLVAGDIEPSEVLAWVDQHMGHLPARPTPPRAAPPLAPPTIGERVADLSHTDPPAVFLAWRTVPIDHPDRPALRMADMLLANGETGLLDTALVAQGRVRSAGGYPRFYRQGGAQVVWARPLVQGDLDNCADLLLEQVDRIRRGDFDPRLLDAVFTNWEVGELGARESNQARVGWMTHAFVQGWSWEHHMGELARHRAVTAADIVRVANDYLGEDRIRLRRHRGTAETTASALPPPAPRATQTDQRSAFAAEVLGRPVPALAPQVTEEHQHCSKTDLANARLFRNSNPFSDLEQAVVVWPTGLCENRCLPYALTLMEQAGADGLDRVGFNTWRYGLGVQMGLECRRKETHLWVAGPNIADALPRILQRFARPVVDTAVARAWVEDSIARRKEDRCTRKTIEAAARAFALYGNDSISLSYTAADEELRALVEFEGDTPAWVNHTTHLPNMQYDAMYTGNNNPERILHHLIPSITSDLPYTPQTRARTSTDRVLFVHHPSVQTAMTAYRTLGPGGIHRLPTIRLLNELYQGGTGVFFQELREKRAMAYATSGGVSAGENPGDDDVLWAQVTTRADKAVDAAGLLVSLLVRPPITDRSFGFARDAATERLDQERIGFRQIPATARMWMRHGYTRDPRAQLREALPRVSTADVGELLGQSAPFGTTLVVVGDAERVSPPEFGAIAPVTVLTADDILSY